jgi:dTDP-4-dehydrorhamnose reductase
VIGASGFLGSRLLALAPLDIECVGTGHVRPVRPGRWREARLDVTSPAQVHRFLGAERPQAVFYCSYDKASRAITVEGAREAARAAAALGARFVFISTDLVYDGRTGGYAESQPAIPTLPYGQLKLEAESAVRGACDDAVILRPSLLVGESGIHQRPAYECGRLVRGQPVDLYTDEFRSPAPVDDVARAAWELCCLEVSGVFHAGGPERLSRFQLGQVLCRLFRFDPRLLRQTARPADRPADTSLNSARLAALLGWAPGPLLASASLPEPAGV